MQKQFSKPLGQTTGTGNLYEIDFEKSQKVKHVIIQEDISKGERVREYKLYGKEDGEWELVNTGSSIGHKRIEVLNKGNYSGIKLEVVRSEGNPIIRKLECY